MVVCSGGFSDPGGRLVAEVNPQTNAVAHSQTPPATVQPSAIAVAATKVWVGDFSLPRLYSLSRADFSIVDGADSGHPLITLPCPAAYSYVADLLVVGSELFALCGATDGLIVRLDASTGALKGPAVGVGGQPVAMALTSDGRIAVTNSTSDQLSLVTDGANVTAVVNAVPFSKSATLQDVKARGRFLYTVASGTNAVQKIDLAAQDQTHLIVAEKATGAGSGPYGILPLDDNQAVVTNNLTGEVVGVNFATSTP
jgi:DNA-binding beta-propeller fold protein YncE